MVTSARKPAPPGTTLNYKSSKGKSVAVTSQVQSDASGSETVSEPNKVKESSPVKPKHKSKKAKKKRTQSPWLDFLTKVLVLCFTIYTIAICPNDPNLASPVCRGLDAYRRLVLEPYLFPQLRRVAELPAVQPYMLKVEQVYMHTVLPVVHTSQQHWDKSVVPQWNKRVVPQWNKRVVPQWNKYVVPQWNQHVVPPYTQYISNPWNEQVSPRIAAVDLVVNPYLVKTQTYLILAHNEYSIRVKPQLVKLAGYAQIYAIIGISYTNDLIETVRPVVKRWIMISVEELRKLRKEWVDLHVERLWDKVVELSKGEPLSAPNKTAEAITPAPVEVPIQDTASETSASDIQPTSTPAVIDTTPIPTTALTLVAESVATTIAPSSIYIPGAKIEEAAPTPVGTPEATETSVADTAASISPAKEQVITGPSLIISASLLPTAVDADQTTPTTTEADPTEPTPDFDVDEWLSSIGIEPVLEEQAAEPKATPAPPTPEELEAEAAAKKAKVAAQRRDIMDRHTAWELKLAEATRTQNKALRSVLVKIRQDGAKALKENNEIREKIDTLSDESAKRIKGAENVIGLIKKSGKPNGDVALGRVIEGLQKKFLEGVENIEGLVNTWYGGILEEESAEVQKATKIVDELSGKAQGDIAMDYAYLDDVTVDDWTRYHDLMRVSENFTKSANEIQQGTHASPPINPIVPLLESLEKELTDIVSGFEVKIWSLRTEGEKAFGTAAVPEDESPVSEDATRSSVAPEPTAEEPVYSILPIQDEVANEVDLGSEEEIIVGKSKEDILAAFERVGWNARIVHEEL